MKATNTEKAERHIVPFPFSTVEKAFKYDYETGRTPGSKEDIPEELQQILISDAAGAESYYQILLNTREGSTLTEAHIFAEKSDIRIIRHPRYMPRIAHTHYFFEVQVVLTGVLKQEINSSCVELLPGNVCFLAPGVLHAPYTYSDDTIMINLLIRRDTFHSTFMNLLHKEDILSDFFARIIYSKSLYPYLLCHMGEDEQANDVILKMLRVEQEGGAYKDRLLRALLETFFIYLLRDHENDFTVPPISGEENENIVKILRYIRNNYRTATLSETAKVFNYSEGYLSRIVKLTTGDSFSKLLISIKLQHAANMLANSNLSISFIIDQVGYDDKSYFYRIFKKRYGVTPAKYRASIDSRVDRLSDSESDN